MGHAGPRERAREAIIRLAHSGLDSAVLRRELAARIQRVVPAASSGFATVDPASLLLTSVVTSGIPDETVPALAQNEYASEDYNKFAELALRPRPVARLSAATGGNLGRSLRYRTIFDALGWGDELRAVFVADRVSWGFICLHRERSDPDFGQEEERFLARLVAHIGEGLRKSLLLAAAETADARDLGPGLIELGDELEVVAMNDAAAAWLEELEPGASADGRLPHALYAVVAQLAALQAHPGLGRIPRIPVRARSGRWLVLHASYLRGPDGSRTLVIVEPAKPLELAPVITRAYGLSAREGEICLLVLRGLSTAEIARRLHISTNTVQDHLKAVFAKAGVRSRRELVGQVFLEEARVPERLH
jgi:DNA-binding CsgD family transcriptional regulator